MTDMISAVAAETAGAELRIAELPIPGPGPGEALVRIQARGMAARRERWPAARGSH